MIPPAIPYCGEVRPPAFPIAMMYSKEDPVSPSSVLDIGPVPSKFPVKTHASPRPTPRPSTEIPTSLIEKLDAQAERLDRLEAALEVNQSCTSSPRDWAKYRMKLHEQRAVALETNSLAFNLFAADLEDSRGAPPCPPAEDTRPPPPPPKLRRPSGEPALSYATPPSQESRPPPPPPKLRRPPLPSWSEVPDAERPPPPPPKLRNPAMTTSEARAAHYDRQASGSFRSTTSRFGNGAAHAMLGVKAGGNAALWAEQPRQPCVGMYAVNRDQTGRHDSVALDAASHWHMPPSPLSRVMLAEARFRAATTVRGAGR